MTEPSASNPLQKKKKLKVAVIGCGPGGMFVCHALETKRRQLVKEIAEAELALQLEQTKSNKDSPTNDGCQLPFSCGAWSSCVDDDNADEATPKATPSAATVSTLQEQLDNLPSIMCFEKAHAPGGVWRSTSASTSVSTKNDTDSSTEGAEKSTDTPTTNTSYKTDTNMYEALWCNGPKEVMEFHDYTFSDHFGQDQKLPIYLPRQAVLDYLLARVTRHCPHFFDTYASFQTNVDLVTYDSTTQLFSVTTTCLKTQTTKTETYDKVIWSAGQNGSGKIPAPISNKFEQAQAEYQQSAKQTEPPQSTTTPTPLPFLHASQLEQRVATQIKGKHLLLIGGSYSAEDLAFMGIKWGATHVTVLTRRHGIDVPICWSINWPHDKVSVIAGYTVNKVEIVHNDKNDNSDDSDNRSYTITLQRYAYENNIAIVDQTSKPKTTNTTITTNNDDEHNNNDSTTTTAASTTKPPSPKSVVAQEDEDNDNAYPKTRILSGVHVVICCTGYSEHLEMLDWSCYNMTKDEYDYYWNGEDKFVLPEDWTMPKNQLSDIIWKYHHDFDGDTTTVAAAGSDTAATSSSSSSSSSSDDAGATADDSNEETKGEEPKMKDNPNDKQQPTTLKAQPQQQQSKDIPPYTETLYPGCYCNPYSYRELLFVHNPNLMWLAANNFDTPLLALDVQACLALRYMTGETPIPTRDEMKADLYQQALHEMSLPLVRYWMDTTYYNAVQKWLTATTRKVYYTDAKGNRCSRYDYPLEWREAYRQTSELELRLLARLMQDADYPLQLGSFDRLNATGEMFMDINWGCRNYGTCSQTGTTFRDVTAAHCATIRSVFTGARPLPLKGKWLDMDDFMEDVSGLVE